MQPLRNKAVWIIGAHTLASALLTILEIINDLGSFCLCGLHLFVVVVWLLSHVQPFCSPMDCSPPGSSVLGFSQAEYWSGLPLPSPGDLPDAGVKPMSAALASGFFTTEPPGKPKLGTFNSIC